MSCGVGHGSDLALRWLWYRPASTAVIRPLAWEPQYAMGVTLKRPKKKKKKERKKKYMALKIKKFFSYVQVYLILSCFTETAFFYKLKVCGEFPLWSVVTNPTSIHGGASSIPVLIQWVKDPSLQ